MVHYMHLYPVVGVVACRYVIVALVTNAMQPHEMVAYVLPRLRLK
jgi:hypothetical protein